jgi:hypothetical protein
MPVAAATIVKKYNKKLQPQTTASDKFADIAYMQNQPCQIKGENT